MLHSSPQSHTPEDRQQRRELTNLSLLRYLTLPCVQTPIYQPGTTRGPANIRAGTLQQQAIQLAPQNGPVFAQCTRGCNRSNVGWLNVKDFSEIRSKTHSELKKQTNNNKKDKKNLVSFYSICPWLRLVECWLEVGEFFFFRW